MLRQVIKAKTGLSELTKQLGNVSQARRVMGYIRDSFALPNHQHVRESARRCGTVQISFVHSVMIPSTNT